MKRLVQYACGIILWLSIQTPVAASVPTQKDFVTMPDGTAIHVVHIPAQIQPARQVAVFLLGLSAFYEKNADFMDLLSGRVPAMSQDTQPPVSNLFTQEGIDVWVVDHRGHGHSGGRLDGSNRQKAHVKDFQIYSDDLKVVIQQKILPTYHNRRTPPAYTLIGSSFGGHVALRYLETQQHPFHKAILIVPMLDFPTKPWPRVIAETLVKAGTFLGFGEAYAPGYHDFDIKQQSQRRERVHHNKQAYEQTIQLLQTHPELITSGPTFAWAAAAFDSVRQSLEPEALKRIQIPVHIFMVTDDTFVDNHGIMVAKQHLPKVYLTTIMGAWHNVMKEVDPYRLPFLKKLWKILHEH